MGVSLRKARRNFREQGPPRVFHCKGQSSGAYNWKIFAQPQYLGVMDLRFHMASLLHSGCPQVIQGPSCMYPSGPNSDQHLWPGQSDGSTLISPEPPNALAPRLLSCR